MQAHDMPPLATLWIGDRLSWLEQLCLTSFVDAGHVVRLYSYGPIEGVPEGVLQCTANDVLPATDFLRHERTGSPAIHADLFRLHLMKKTPCLWIDADMLCWRPFINLGAYVFGWEKPGIVCNAVLRLPENSPTLDALIDFLSEPNPIPPWASADERAEMQKALDDGNPISISKQRWGTSGPAALTYFLRQTGEIAHARPEAAFYPIPFADRRKMVLRRHAHDANFTQEVMGVHLWGRRIKRRLLSEPEALPRPGSFLARMIKRHRIQPAEAPILDDRPKVSENA